MNDIFDRYAPFIRDFIYDHEWRTLRGIQLAAADALFNTDDNVLLLSSTASGKTEAAFFPILTDLWENPSRSVGALYISPLKALINDQFYRLDDICKQADIAVWHWHGDVSTSHKAKLIKHPSGILQITPESLEALLLRRQAVVASLFCDLRYIVVDELHSFLSSDRGLQMLCLLERLGRAASVNPRRVALSATIGDPQAAADFIGAGTGRKTIIPRVEQSGQLWHIGVEHFYTTGLQADGIGSQAAAPQADGTSSQPAATGPQAGTSPLSSVDPSMRFIFEYSRNKKCLVFSNSREECEEVTTTLRSYCAALHEPDRFLIHHGNLSASFRQAAEDSMREQDNNLTTCATATLELGIDVGRLERAFQIDAPFTVSSFLQRMGRTGRRGMPCEMQFVIREDQPEPRTTLPELFPYKLLQTIALVQLYVEEHWVEPVREGRMPFSLLYHQTMATLASQGELSPVQLAQRVLTMHAFQNITTDDYATLLRHLISTDHIAQTEEGTLIVGLAGERSVNSFHFYAVFAENKEYKVFCENQELGTVVRPSPPGEKLAIAGHVWLIEEVDHKRQCVFVTQIKGKVPAYFGEVPGDIHTKVLERMRQVLCEKKQYPYLGSHAQARLATARHLASQTHIDRSYLISTGEDSWVLFPWLGSYAFLALERIIKRKLPPQLGIKGVSAARPYFIQFRMKASAAEFFDALNACAANDLDLEELLYQHEVPVFEKYDGFVPAELIRKGFAHGVLDVSGAIARIADFERSCAAQIPASVLTC